MQNEKKVVHQIEKNKPPKEKTMDAKTAHIVEAARLAIESHKLKTRLDVIHARVGELSYILMTMDQMELQKEKESETES